MPGFPFKTGFSAQSKRLRIASHAPWYCDESQIREGMALPPYGSNNHEFCCQLAVVSATEGSRAGGGGGG